jgi:hypothetical protein
MDRDSCPFKDKNEAYIRTEVADVNHEEEWFVVSAGFLAVDTPKLPFDMLGEDAVQKLPFRARESPRKSTTGTTGAL